MFGTSAKSHEEAMKDKKLPRGKGRWFRYKLIMEDFPTAFDAALDYVALRLKLGRLWFLADGLSFRLACHRIKSYADNYIQQAAAHAAEAASKPGHETGCKIKTVMTAGTVSFQISSMITRIRLLLRNQVLQLLVAGRDTTAATPTWGADPPRSTPLVLCPAPRGCRWHIWNRGRAESSNHLG